MTEVIESTELTLEEENQLKKLGLVQGLILDENGEMRQWEPQSLEDAVYYLEREIAEIENLLKNSAERSEEFFRRQVEGQVIVLPGDRPRLTVPSGGPSDTDLCRKKSELESKLETLKSPS